MVHFRRRTSMWKSPRTAGALCIALALSVSAAHARQDSVAPTRTPARTQTVCGWDWSAHPSMPASVADLLARLDATAGEPPSDAVEAAQHLTQWFERCDAGASRRAVAGFRKASAAAPDNQALRALYGVALARGDEIQPVGASGYLYRTVYHFSNAERDASRIFKSVTEQTGWRSAGLEAAALALGTRHTTSLREAAEALQAVVKMHPDDAEAWAALAEVQTARKEYETAIEAGQRAADVGSPTGMRALAVVRFIRNAEDTVAARLYQAGLDATNADAANADALDRYYEDLRPLLSDREIAQWTAIPGDGRAAWIRGRWEWRASQAGITVAARLATHHRRLARAIDSYMRTAVRGPRPDGALSIDSLQGPLPFQDQGLVYIRHGEPDEVVNGSSGLSGDRRVAWIYYDIGTDPTVIEFRKVSDYADFVAVGPQECDPLRTMYGGSGPSAEGKLRRFMQPPRTTPRRDGRGRRIEEDQPTVSPADAPAQGWEQAFQREVLDFSTAVATYAPSYGIQGMRCIMAVASALRNHPGDAEFLLSEIDGQKRLQAEARTLAQLRFEDALRLENAAPVFTRPLRPSLSVYTFRENRAPSVVAFIALPGSALTAATDAGGASYRLDLFMAVENPATETITRADTTLTLHLPAAMTPGQTVKATVQLPAVPPGESNVRVGVYNANDRSQGQVALTARTVPAYTDAFAVSDIVIAEPEGGIWRRGSVALSPIPGHAIVRDAAYRMFYEMYGVREGDVIQTAITITPVAAKSLVGKLRELVQQKQAMSVRFEDRATIDPDGVARSFREIANDLIPGDYVIETTLQQKRTGTVATVTTNLRVSN